MVVAAPQPPVPNQDEITVEWMAAALGRPGELADIGRKPIGTGQVGENIRYRLRWVAGTAQHPSSVVGKHPSDDPTSRATAATTEAYVKEIGFYRDLQPSVDIRTPRIDYLAESIADNSFVLIMEDLDSARPGDQLVGCSPEQARLAVVEAAGLHGPLWGREPQRGRSWLAAPTAERNRQRSELYDLVFTGFAARYQSRLESEVIELGRWLGSVLDSWPEQFATPQTLIHGDYRLDNMLFTEPTGSDDGGCVTVIDWQTTGVGHGPSDVAYFLGAGLLPETRRAEEVELVGQYQRALAPYGVTADDAVWNDYRLGSVTGYLMAVIASQIVVQTERGDEMFCVMAERHAEQMSDLGLPSLVGGRSGG